MTVPAPLEPRLPSGPSPRGGHRPRRAFSMVAVVLVAFVAAAAVALWLRGSSAGDTTAGSSSVARGAPAMHIHPQRAQAGPPLTLRVEGQGCPGDSAVLSITRAGTAGGAELDQLVVRRRIERGAEGRFLVEPVLVGQPPGTYQVTLVCSRYRLAPGIDTDPGRDVFVLNEVLELYGEGGAAEFSVTPRRAEPHTRTEFALSGSGCDGDDALVEVRVFPPSAMDPGPLEVRTVTPRQGSWALALVVDATAAEGTYALEAVCRDPDGVRFAYAGRHVHFGDLIMQVVPVPSTWDDLLDDLGIRLKTVTPSASDAVTAAAGTDG